MYASLSRVMARVNQFKMACRDSGRKSSSPGRAPSPMLPYRLAFLKDPAPGWAAAGVEGSRSSSWWLCTQVHMLSHTLRNSATL
jgi:hypothetical protein